MPEGGLQHVIDDWKLLVDRMKLGRDDKDRAYLQHGGKPVVAVWGIGFNDGRKYTLAECERLVEFLKHDKQYGGCTVLVGVPTGWRTLDADSVPDKQLHEVIGRADIISPWTVGRYRIAQGGGRPCRAAVEGRPGVVPGAQEEIICRWSSRASAGTTAIRNRRWTRFPG